MLGGGATLPVKKNILLRPLERQIIILSGVRVPFKDFGNEEIFPLRAFGKEEIVKRESGKRGNNFFGTLYFFGTKPPIFRNKSLFSGSHPLCEALGL